VIRLSVWFKHMEARIWRTIMYSLGRCCLP
jgi:hypothetical protein